MGTKTVRFREDVYERTRSRKRDDEWFSEAIDRLTGDASLLISRGRSRIRRPTQLARRSQRAAMPTGRRRGRILDTSFLIALQNGTDAATETAQEIERRSRPRRVPHVVSTGGAGRVPRGLTPRRFTTCTSASREGPRRKRTGIGSIAFSPRFPWSRRRPRSHAEPASSRDSSSEPARASARSMPSSVRPVLEYVDPVVIADVAHFERMEGVEVETY